MPSAQDRSSARPPQALFLEHLLAPFGLDLTAPALRVKLVRHMDKQVDVWKMYRGGELERYQALQASPRFDGVDIVVSFLGKPSTHAIFVGAYSVGARSLARTLAPPQSADLHQVWSRCEHHYELVPIAGLEALRERVVVDWGRGTLAWAQWFRPNDKPVVEVLPAGYTMEFPGYLEVKLTFDELRRMIRHPATHREWHMKLGAVAGVYLVLDTHSGRQYVGSACGKDGILGRWKDYAEGGHAGNKQLKALVESDAGTLDRLQFSILQTLPNTLTAREVITWEVLHKEKLGSRAHGLNSN